MDGTSAAQAGTEGWDWRSLAVQPEGCTRRRAWALAGSRWRLQGGALQGEGPAAAAEGWVGCRAAPGAQQADLSCGEPAQRSKRRRPAVTLGAGGRLARGAGSSAGHFIQGRAPRRSAAGRGAAAQAAPCDGASCIAQTN